ncbi:MAG: hypothetical protein AAB308_14590 [Nitrospirota bacterium]
MLSRDWCHQCIAKCAERDKGPLDIVRDQLNDEIGILGKAQVAMGIHRKPASDQISDTGVIERSDNRFEARQFHNAAIVADVGSES